MNNFLTAYVSRASRGELSRVESGSRLAATKSNEDFPVSLLLILVLMPCCCWLRCCCALFFCLHLSFSSSVARCCCCRSWSALESFRIKNPTDNSFFDLKSIKRESSSAGLKRFTSKTFKKNPELLFWKKFVQFEFIKITPCVWRVESGSGAHGAIYESAKWVFFIILWKTY